MELREARREDVPAIVRMLADDPLGAEREKLGDPLQQEYWTAFDGMLANPDNLQLVADLDGEIVGTLQLIYIKGLSRLGAERAQIEAVRVASAHRGRDLGRQMVEAAIGMARDRGCLLVQLTSDKQRGDALRFYERLGFVASHEGLKLILD